MRGFIVFLLLFSVPATSAFGEGQPVSLETMVRGWSVEDDVIQDMAWLRGKIELLKSSVNKDPAKALDFWRHNRSVLSQNSNLEPINPEATHQDIIEYYNNNNTWVADFNSDGVQDIGSMFFGGSANCMSAEILLSSSAGFTQFTGTDLFGEPNQEGAMQYCSGGGHTAGIKPIKIDGQKLWFTYSFFKSGGKLRLLEFNPAGGILIRDQVTFDFKLDSFVESEREDGKYVCGSELCQRALEVAQLDLKQIHGALENYIRPESPLLDQFVASYEEAGKAAENSAHPWGRYSEYNVRFVAINFENINYVVKIAPGGIGWREWCCGISIYQPREDGFEAVAHMFTQPNTRLEILKD